MADNNENKVLNVPHLRFPEFSGEWNKYTINDLATVVGGGTPDTTVKSYWGGDIQCIYNHRTTKTNQKYPSVNL